MSTKTATSWPTLDTAELAAAHNLPTAPAALTEDIAAHGIQEPLYVTTTPTGALRVVDGLHRLAAAVAASITHVPVTYRPLIHVTALTAHPGNVRRDLKLSADFIQSIKVNGIRTAIQVTRTAEGTLRVVDGHRRLAAAIKAKISHVPYTYEDQSEAGQMLDMVTTARHRAGLTASEETAALFEAASLGADAKAMAAAASVTVTQARQIQRLTKYCTVRTAAATAATMTLEEYAILAELEKTDPKAASEATDAIEADPTSQSHGWIVRRARTESEARARLAAHRAELEATGAPIRIRTLAELKDSATRISRLGLSAAEHATCQGHVWVADHIEYAPYCTNPELFGHKMPADADADTTPQPTASERHAIIEGGKDWDTAEEIRREWLATFFGKARRPKAETDLMNTITARVLMSGADVFGRRARHPQAIARLNSWFGITEHSDGETRAKAVTPAKAAAMALGAIVTAYEQHTARTVWRTDGRHADAWVRAVAAEYLTWLTELGYQPTPIEQAVIDGQPYHTAAVALADAEANGKTIN